MDHRIRPDSLGNRGNLLIPFSSERSRRHAATAKALFAGGALSIMAVPVAIVAVIIALVKPDGALGPDSNTTFWLLASAALALAVAVGSIAIVLMARLILGWYVDSLAWYLRKNQPELVQDLDQDLAWIDDLPVEADRR